MHLCQIQQILPDNLVPFCEQFDWSFFMSRHTELKYAEAAKGAHSSAAPAPDSAFCKHGMLLHMPEDKTASTHERMQKEQSRATPKTWMSSLVNSGCF